MNLEHLLLPVPQIQPSGLGDSPDPGEELQSAGLETPLKRGAEPQWQSLLQKSEAILANSSKSLDAALLWTVSSVQARGLSGLADGLQLFSELLSKFWETLAPANDGTDPYPRAQVVSELAVEMAKDPGPCRIIYRLACHPLFPDSGAGTTTIGHALKAINSSKWPGSPEGPTLAELQIECRETSVEVLKERADVVQSAVDSLQSIRQAFKKRNPVAEALHLGPLEEVLAALKSIYGSPHSTTSVSAHPSTSESISASGPTQPNDNASSRAAAISALGRVQSHLRSHESASPVIPLLQLASEVKGLSFMDSLKRISPSNLADLKKFFGAETAGKGNQSTPPDPPDEGTTNSLSSANRDKLQASLDRLKLPLKERPDVDIVLETVDFILGVEAPTSPVLTLVRLARTAHTRTFAETAERFQGDDVKSLADIFTPPPSKPESKS